MPGSSQKGKKTIKNWFDHIPNNNLVLDVGPGWGTYSKYLKEKGQIWHAVEIHKPYVKRFRLKKYYDKIFIEDIRKFIPEHRYETIICGDILEHISNLEAQKVLQRLLKYGKHIIVSLPLDAETNPPPGTGDKDWGNIHELHIGSWSDQLFKKTIEKIEGKLTSSKKYREIAIYHIEPKRKYKIVGICQVYNELEKGNLKRFLKYIKPVVDDLVVYDDGSTDGSFEYLERNVNHIIRSSKNDFTSEISHRQLMLEKALTLQPDYILWLDADEVLSAGAEEKIQKLCQYTEKNKIDAMDFHEINIWRSATWKRTDSLYNDGWFPRLWRVTPQLAIRNVRKGLHHEEFFPISLKKREKTSELAVLHYGFSNKKSLAYKYLIYRSHGQRGYNHLDRLINEDKLKLEKIPKSIFPPGLWRENDLKPEMISFIEALSYVEKYRDQVFRPKYSIACLVYKSVDWLKFVHEQVLRYTDMTDKEFYFVANDATPEVLKYLHDNYIPHYVFCNSEKQKKDWYINNVYRAWNYAAKCAKGDFIVFINSDMAFTSGWFEKLISAYRGNNCLASRLVESGKLKSGTFGIEKNFGKNHTYFEENAFQKYAKKIAENRVQDGGLYMPLLIRKEHFLKVNGYPEGNIKPKSDIFHPKIAKQGEAVIPGDRVLMEKLQTIGITHQTVFNSIVYHFQCGEMDEKKISKSNDKVQIAICNDLTTGTMGEKVLWDYLLEKLPGAYSVDKRVVEAKGNFEENARNYINTNYPETSIIIQNATFIETIDKNRYTISYLQDDLRAMKRKSVSQEHNLKEAKKIISNSYQTALSYADFESTVIPIGINDRLFKVMDKKKLRKKHGFKSGKIGIFVGNFSEVKGWSKVEKSIKNHPEIFWILVSKYKEDCKSKNVKVYNQINQKLLAELLNCADFFIIGSPVETLCLAAIEAGFCNLPLVMPKVGIFKGFSDQELAKIGVFDDNLEQGIKEVFKKKFNPREVLKTKNLDIEGMIIRWQKIIEKAVLEMDIKKNLVLSKKIKLFYRKKIKKIIFNDEEFDFKYFFKTAPKKTFDATKVFSIQVIYKTLLKTGLLPIVKKVLKRNEK